MSKITVIGHKNADTDSVVSAVVYSRFIEGGVPAVSGEVNKETEFVFSYFKEQLPLSVEKVEGDVFLVDHNEIAQSVEGVTKENIVGVIDHHQLSGLETSKPVFFRIEPLGSTATLIYKMIRDFERKEAGLLLSAIVSDTLNLTSITTTDEDREAVKDLALISGVDVDELAEKMFAAKSDFSGKTLEEVVKGDMKEFSFSGKRVGIAVSEVTSDIYFQEKEDEILKSLKKIKEEESYDAFFFGVVDILKKETRLYLIGEEERRAAKDAFGLDGDNYIILPDVVSRKSQIAPPLSNVFNQ